MTFRTPNRTSNTQPAMTGGVLLAVSLLASCATPMQAGKAVPVGGDGAAADTADREARQGQAMATESNEAAASTPSQGLPSGFHAYADRPAGDRACLVGAVTDEDGMHQRPVVALADGKTGGKNRVVAWARHFDVLEDAYQARATHCVLGDDALYALLQTDTQSQQTLSQTVLSVAKLDLHGEVLDTRPLDIPDTTGQAYSAYVAEMPGDFRWEGGRLRIRGEYFLLSDPDTRKPFAVDLTAALAP